MNASAGNTRQTVTLNSCGNEVSSLIQFGCGLPGAPLRAGRRGPDGPSTRMLCSASEALLQASTQTSVQHCDSEPRPSASAPAKVLTRDILRNANSALCRLMCPPVRPTCRTALRPSSGPTLAAHSSACRSCRLPAGARQQVRWGHNSIDISYHNRLGGAFRRTPRLGRRTLENR